MAYESGFKSSFQRQAERRVTRNDEAPMRAHSPQLSLDDSVEQQHELSSGLRGGGGGDSGFRRVTKRTSRGPPSRDTRGLSAASSEAFSAPAAAPPGPPMDNPARRQSSLDSLPDVESRGGGGGPGGGVGGPTPQDRQGGGPGSVLPPPSRFSGVPESRGGGLGGGSQRPPGAGQIQEWNYFDLFCTPHRGIRNGGKEPETTHTAGDDQLDTSGGMGAYYSPDGAMANPYITSPGATSGYYPQSMMLQQPQHQQQSVYPTHQQMQPQAPVYAQPHYGGGGGGNNVANTGAHRWTYQAY